jgi:hypothetical protein
VKRERATALFSRGSPASPAVVSRVELPVLAPSRAARKEQVRARQVIPPYQCSRFFNNSASNCSPVRPRWIRS